MPSKKLSENSLITLKARYLWQKKHRFETPAEMFDRVAKSVSNGNPSLKKKFRNAMTALDFLPNSPTLMNAGKKEGQLAACFVLPLEDNLESIMETLKHTALIHQSGGGTGFSFSKLRAKNSILESSHRAAAGPIGFLRLFNELTHTIKQGGLRRGANMGVLSIHHPDIEEFIDCKTDTSQLTNFNISVSIPDTFFEAVHEDKAWPLKDPKTGKTVKTVRAKILFDKIVESAWKTGEPGLIFIDEINRKNPTPHLGQIVATNPCGEQPLLDYEACNLGSINLNSVVSESSGAINWTKLEEIAETGVLFLDGVIDVCHYPIKQIEDRCRSSRKIGLGVMGFADLLLKTGTPYGSQESLNLAEQIMRTIRETAVSTSQRLAKKKGSFEGFSKSLWKKSGYMPMRNATLTTLAPTGTISLIAGASPGIEPIYNFILERNVLDGTPLREIHPFFETTIKKNGKDLGALSALLSREMSLRDSDLPLAIKNVFKTTTDISPREHVEVQATFQKFSDSAVSKTINLHNKSPRTQVAEAFELAHQLQCKGITVYRDGSRPSQVLNSFCPDCVRYPADPEAV